MKQRTDIDPAGHKSDDEHRDYDCRNDVNRETEKDESVGNFLFKIEPNVHSGLLVAGIAALVTLLGAAVWAAVDGLPSLVERTAVMFLWTHTDFHDGTMYTNGVYWKSFPASHTVMLTNSPDGTNTYGWTALLPAGGVAYQFTLRLADSNQVPSDPSPTLTQYVRLAGPGWLGSKEK